LRVPIRYVFLGVVLAVEELAMGKVQYDAVGGTKDMLSDSVPSFGGRGYWGKGMTRFIGGLPRERVATKLVKSPLIVCLSLG
jgi:hypothetical protein